MERDLRKRSNNFAHKCVKLALSFPKGVLQDHVQKQLIRASTSVAANYRAANLGQTKRSFISKLSIVIEEADECIFWIEFLVEENILTEGTYELVLEEARQLTAIFIASRKTAVKSQERS
ncbi:four helix bundle protein [Salinimicrobium sp. MT39]|uniref:Four helix bundle protein n=1 Tax=Salinimicrobium profundisediminis TaxID=2994553 RepID=A0A9X3I0M6_9FLAO|nr:four helix bundle protein [Salinimicrobium profundisediminis]MCX2837709.1 four helix bundle protein [Salinimicrobium profundisediminis]